SPARRSAISSTTSPNGRRFLSKGSWNSSRPSAARRLQEDGDSAEGAQERPPLLGRLSLDLQKRVVAHRNDVSEHLREPRYSPGAPWDADGKIRIEMGLAYPIDADRDVDTRTTEAPADLMAALDECHGVMAQLIRA